jgi:hypothetical protein
VLPTLLIAAALSGAAPSPDYAIAYAAALSACNAINLSDYQSGLALNPDGYRSYYVRSQCLQNMAVQFRDAALCGKVRQRRALFSSSWGHSPGNCRKLVAAAIDADREELEELKRQYQMAPMVLRDVRVEPNGNGRDYDVLPSFEGTQGHGYVFTLELLPSNGPPVVVHTNGYYVDPRSALRLFIRQQEIASRFPAFVPGRMYRVRAVATFSLPSSGGSRFMSDAFLERVFPLRERTQSIERDVRF